MKYVILTQGKRALVSENDFERVNQFKWGLSKNAVSRTEYAYRRERRNGKLVSVNMHSFIMGVQKGKEVDHKNGNGLDNQRNNLRVCTHAENIHNSRMYKNNTSGYKGVYFHKKSNKWLAQINKDGKWKYLGIYTLKEEAANAYQKAARELFGEFVFT